MNDKNAAAFAGAGPEIVFRDRLQSGHFEIQQCARCSEHIFYPRVLCPHCGSEELRWVAPSGRGTVYSTTVVRRKPDEGGDYNIALINLAEGPRMMSRVEEVPPVEVRIGMAVRARVQREGENAIVVWIPAGEKR